MTTCTVDSEGLTSCCRAITTFHDLTECCKACYREVTNGEGPAAYVDLGEAHSNPLGVPVDDELGPASYRYDY